jgi:glycerol uptake facilitator-like aquaporin
VPAYFGGQFIGALLASALTYCVFFDAIAWKEAVGSDEFYTDATAGIFCTIPNVWLTTRGAIVDNLIGTAALLLGL